MESCEVGNASLVCVLRHLMLEIFDLLGLFFFIPGSQSFLASTIITIGCGGGGETYHIPQKVFFRLEKEVESSG